MPRSVQALTDWWCMDYETCIHVRFGWLPSLISRPRLWSCYTKKPVAPKLAMCSPPCLSLTRSTYVAEELRTHTPTAATWCSVWWPMFHSPRSCPTQRLNLRRRPWMWTFFRGSTCGFFEFGGFSKPGEDFFYLIKTVERSYPHQLSFFRFSTGKA
jgi:hypothetical protein